MVSMFRTKTAFFEVSCHGRCIFNGAAQGQGAFLHKRKMAQRITCVDHKQLCDETSFSNNVCLVLFQKLLFEKILSLDPDPFGLVSKY